MPENMNERIVENMLENSVRRNCEKKVKKYYVTKILSFLLCLLLLNIINYTVVCADISVEESGEFELVYDGKEPSQIKKGDSFSVRMRVKKVSPTLEKLDEKSYCWGIFALLHYDSEKVEFVGLDRASSLESGWNIESKTDYPEDDYCVFILLADDEPENKYFIGEEVAVFNFVAKENGVDTTMQLTDIDCSATEWTLDIKTDSDILYIGSALPNTLADNGRKFHIVIFCTSVILTIGAYGLKQKYKENIGYEDRWKVKQG